MEEISKTLYEEQTFLRIFLNVGFTENDIQREIYACRYKGYTYIYEEAAKSLLLSHFMNNSKREGMDILKRVCLCDFESVEFVHQLNLHNVAGSQQCFSVLPIGVSRGRLCTTV